MPTRLQWLRARVIHASFAETQIETHDVHRLVVGFVDGDGERLTNSRPYGERFLSLGPLHLAAASAIRMVERRRRQRRS